MKNLIKIIILAIPVSCYSFDFSMDTVHSTDLLIGISQTLNTNIIYNSDSDTLVIDSIYMTSLDSTHCSEILFYAKTINGIYGYNFSINPSINDSLIKIKYYPNLPSSPLLKISPKDSLCLFNFILGSCFICVSKRRSVVPDLYCTNKLILYGSNKESKSFIITGNYITGAIKQNSIQRKELSPTNKTNKYYNILGQQIPKKSRKLNSNPKTIIIAP